jgi:hypothetical protein
MISANLLWRKQQDRLRSNGSRVTMAADAPSTLLELVGIVLDPETQPVARKTPGTLQDLRPRLLMKQSA